MDSRVERDLMSKVCYTPPPRSLFFLRFPLISNNKYPGGDVLTSELTPGPSPLFFFKLNYSPLKSSRYVPLALTSSWMAEWCLGLGRMGLGTTQEPDPPRYLPKQAALLFIKLTVNSHVISTVYSGYGSLPSWSDIVHRNSTGGSQNGTFLPLENIQGDILYVHLLPPRDVCVPACLPPRFRHLF